MNSTKLYTISTTVLILIKAQGLALCLVMPNQILVEALGFLMCDLLAGFLAWRGFVIQKQRKQIRIAGQLTESTALRTLLGWTEPSFDRASVAEKEFDPGID